MEAKTLRVNEKTYQTTIDSAQASLDNAKKTASWSHRKCDLGGQQQRASIARAIATSPALLLADEPTGNLDSQCTAEVLDSFEQIHRGGRTIVLITHEDDVATRAKRVIRLRDGEIISDTRHDTGGWTRPSSPDAPAEAAVAR